MSIHPQAAAGFDRAAEEYERGRPQYPPAAIDWLAEWLDLAPGRTVLDVGAGTGRQPLHRAIDEIIDAHRGGTPAYRGNEWARVFEDSPWFRLRGHEEIASEQFLDADGLVDRVLSISYVAALEGDECDRVEARVRALAEDGLEPLRHTTQVFVYGRRG